VHGQARSVAFADPCRPRVHVPPSERGAGAGPGAVGISTGGEAIAYTADGGALLTSSEGEHAPIYELRRKAGE